MEEDVGVKAPVTRLRRRLSVDQDDVKSPSAPSTPTKKRGGRLAAKPQLELIDENSSENTPKKQLKKSAVKDVIEAKEDKVLTPSRRSTRIKSNTSILSDTPQTFDSPRAKRAARRNSQIGSDNEAPTTPARQTRRTRKDSTSSIDKQETVTSAKKATTIANSIIEEVESDSQKANSVDQNKKSEITPKRKSPRLQKKNKVSNATENEEVPQEIDNISNVNKQDESKITKDSISPNSKVTDKNKLSDESFKLLNNLNEQPVKKKFLNKSTSSVTAKKAIRNRTNTWTASQSLIDASVELNKQDKEEITKLTKDNIDIEEAKSNNDHSLGSDRMKSYFMEKDSKDGLNSSASKEENKIIDDPNLGHVSGEKLNLNMSLFNKSNDVKNTTNNICVLNETENLIRKAPVAAVQSFVYFEDSDTDSREKPTNNKIIENEDQCVPFVAEINQNKKLSDCGACEPMDIDETIPSNVSLINCSESKQDINKSLEQKPISEQNISKNSNKSKRASSSSLSTSQNIEKLGNENKSTLILSQLKDVSTTDNSLTKSPKTAVEFLSSSVNEINKDKKDSLDYMTSTPLQQKNLRKMAIQINTSDINDFNNRSTKKYDKHKNNKSTDASSSEESDDHVSKEKSDFLDEEADEVSDDYASGDSRDEEEKQYEKENEILEKGETLDSHDDASNDTDYEKDSFVVSSDEEDNELLSGSGDDLSMSDNELTQSKISKKKFNDRKLKEQKKASREMFEARHNISNNSSKSDVNKKEKNKRRRLNSSAFLSEEDTVVKSKKNKQLKLDSSEDSTEEDDTKVEKKSISATEENEITTVFNESVVNKNDPLSMQVKLEPQTPLKDINISTVPIHDQIEEVHLDQNISVMKINETSDPLQEESETSSISENMEISSNYDSVLKELNKEMNNKHIKSLDSSLNLNKKIKQKTNPAIVDNLNLTNTKMSKRNLQTSTDTKAKTQDSQNTQDKDKETQKDFDESSSDSIDLQLLFSEDSCDSVKKVQKKRHQKEDEGFIPLKRTEAKTNILEDNDCMNERQDLKSLISQSNLDTLNISANKKKKKVSLSVPDDIHNITGDELNKSLNKTNHETSVNNTNSKMKNKTANICNPEEVVDIAGSGSAKKKNIISQNESSQNISLNTSGRKKKKSSITLDDIKDHNIHITKSDRHDTVPVNQTVCDISLNSSHNTSSKKKKKNSLSVGDDSKDLNRSQNQHDIQNEFNSNISINTTLNTSAKKKKKNSISANEEESNTKNTDCNNSINKSNLNVSINTSLNTNSKKTNKENSISTTEDILLDTHNDTSSLLNTSSKKNKKNKISMENVPNDSVDKLNEDVTVDRHFNSSLNNDSFKKKKHNASAVLDLEDSLNTSSKKNQKVKVQNVDKYLQDDDSDAAPEEIPYASHKNTSAAELSDGVQMFIDTEGNQDWNTLITNGSSKKKNKKKKASQDVLPDSNELTPADINNEAKATSKKRKRKSSANSITQETITAGLEEIVEPVYVENKRKKQKICQNELSPPKMKENINKPNKKRKEREDDDVNKLTKAFKQNSTDKLNVTRLPPTILNQLDDKPRKDVLEMKKAKVVSTSQFIVEEAKKRKNKPSNYLEESVYLNDSVDNKKQKGFIKIPKVLPFIPTATLSGSGFTTKFQINVLQKETKFVAQTSNVTGFKNEYLSGKKVKKVGTYEMYKSQRNKKLSKF
ncbi:putative uncharacterized protein DDB_G0282133 [Amyelois transitella]|uniref:putative uncharacterized protein DDB_G0282133 n=1 Tax=Amyelois transitella TaxID=680683 RepID=UPI002990590B|nr:putative uncharacterized protein DDB_G0282133 [Amyelois transitella]